MAKAKVRTWVTIREIEAASPCSGEYWKFLNDIKSNPIEDGPYAESGGKVKKPRYGPDDRIELADALKVKSSSRDFDPASRLNWIVQKVAALESLATAFAAAYDRLEDSLTARAWEEALGVRVSNAKKKA